jgi:hypothetical protein
MKKKSWQVSITSFILLSLFTIKLNGQQVASAIQFFDYKTIYIGIANPIKIVCTEKFDSISIDNANAVLTEGTLPTNFAKFDIYTLYLGDLSLKIFQKGKCILENKLVARRLPKPKLKLNEEYAPDEITKEHLLQIDSFSVGIPALDFSDFRIVEITLTFRVNGEYKGQTISGNKVNAYVKQLLDKVDKDTNIEIEWKVKDNRNNDVTSKYYTYIKMIT